MIVIECIPKYEKNALKGYWCPGGGGESGTEGAAPAEEEVFFKTSACPRFWKRRVLFVPRYEVWGSKSPYNPRNIRGSDAD